MRPPPPGGRRSAEPWWSETGPPGFLRFPRPVRGRPCRRLVAARDADAFLEYELAAEPTRDGEQGDPDQREEKRRAAHPRRLVPEPGVADEQAHHGEVDHHVRHADLLRVPRGNRE